MSASEPVDRASELLREERPTGWAETGERIRERVGNVTRGGTLLLAATEGGREGSRVLVSSRLLVSRLRAAADPDAALDDVEPTVEDEVLREVQLSVVGRYGTDVHAAGERVRLAAEAVVADLLGPVDATVGVRVVDVVVGDPHQG